MPIYAIADLHLSLAGSKPMDIFGEEWRNHDETIKRNWDQKVSNSDLILIAGDISWAMRLEEALPDLQYIAERPGRKVIIRGNHDYWWKREHTRKIQQVVDPSITLLQGQSLVIEDIGITGTRGWRMDDIAGAGSQEADRRILQRELNYFETGLQGLPEGLELRIAVLHYPPFTPDLQPNEFLKLAQEHAVDVLIYGHIHKSVGEILEGNIDGVELHLAAVDHIDFAPKLIIPDKLGTSPI